MKPNYQIEREMGFEHLWRNDLVVISALKIDPSWIDFFDGMYEKGRERAKELKLTEMKDADIEIIKRNLGFLSPYHLLFYHKEGIIADYKEGLSDGIQENLRKITPSA